MEHEHQEMRSDDEKHRQELQPLYMVEQKKPPSQVVCQYSLQRQSFFAVFQ